MFKFVAIAVIATVAIAQEEEEVVELPEGVTMEGCMVKDEETLELEAESEDAAAACATACGRSAAARACNSPGTAASPAAPSPETAARLALGFSLAARAISRQSNACMSPVCNNTVQAASSLLIYSLCPELVWTNRMIS